MTKNEFKAFQKKLIGELLLIKKFIHASEKYQFIVPKKDERLVIQDALAELATLRRSIF